MELLRQEIRADLEAIRQAKIRSDFWTKVMVFILGASVLLNGIIIWGYYRASSAPVITYNQETLPVTTKQVKRGERLGYLVDFCKNREIEGSVVRSLIYEDGGQIAGEQSSATAQSIGCRTITVYTFEVPANAKLGKAKLLITTIYRTSTFQPQTYRKYTEEFEIVE